MPHRISFFTYSEWDSDRGCVAFIALVDGLRTRCLIDAEALLALTQEKGVSPILVFSEHREAVEEVARRLIQEGRLDGRELMIRIRDVESAPTPQPTPAPAAIAVIRPAAELIDGRRMSMSPESRAIVWTALCHRQKQEWEALSHDAPHEPAACAQQELDRFNAGTIPATAHELNLRRIEAGQLTASWKARLTAAKENSLCSMH